jgi:hypothetical protein
VSPAGTEAVAGVTEIELSTAAVTARVADPLTAPEVAVMVAVPVATPAANPPLFIVATELEDEVQVTLLVKFCVVLLLYVPVAVNCCVLPAATVAEAGVTEILVRTAGVTVKADEPLIVPEVAVIVVVPVATLVASPLLLTVATEVDEDVQVAVLLRFCVLPLL